MTQPGNCFHSSFPVWLRNIERRCRRSHPEEYYVASSWRNSRMGDPGREGLWMPCELSEVLTRGILLDQLHLYSCSVANNKCFHRHDFIWCNDCDVYGQGNILYWSIIPLFYFLSLKDEEIVAQAVKGIAPGVSVVSQIWNLGILAFSLAIISLYLVVYLFYAARSKSH